MTDFSILIACEESQTECLAFRAAGFDAYSCDIQECTGGHPEFHICGDVRPYLKGQREFTTQDGARHEIREWRMIIAHPPCTYLTAASNTQLYLAPGKLNPTRLLQGWDAARFFMECYNAQAAYVAVENPRPFRIWNLPTADCRFNPYEFGAPWSKRTYLWLRNLPPLLPTCYNPRYKSFVHTRRGGKDRSKSFPEVARAMVEQWGSLII